MAFNPVDCRVVMEKEDPAKSRGFGFVTFGNSGDAERAHAELNGKEIDGRTVRTDFAGDARRNDGAQAPPPAAVKLFVGGLAWATTDSDLQRVSAVFK